MKTKTPSALIVTTAHKGVFFGYGDYDLDLAPKTLRLERARMCVYWSDELHGVLGLATAGPSKNCKIGPAVAAITLQDVTAVIEVTDAAVAKWESEPWA